MGISVSGFVEYTPQPSALRSDPAKKPGRSRWGAARAGVHPGYPAVVTPFAFAAVCALGLLVGSGSATAGELRFPASDEDYGHFYPTAYFDQGGTTDWACSDLTYGGHRGSDFGVGSWTGMEEGREIVAAAAGVVTATNDGVADDCTTGDCDGGGGYGNYVWIQHPDGTQTIYAHMRTWTVAVSTGQSVACGDYLGQVGSSGYSTGPHLHFEVRDAAGDRVDPFNGSCNASTSRWVEQGSHGGLPAPTCADLPACEPVQALTCGDVISSRNDGAGSTSTHAFYGCSTYTYTGPEQAFEVRSAAAETVTVRLTGLSADLDLYLLDDTACDASGCLGASIEPDGTDEAVSVQASAGVPLILVVDGYEGAVSDFSLSVECASPWVEAEPDPGGDTGSPGSADGGAGASDGGTLDEDAGTPVEPSDAPGALQPLHEEPVGCVAANGPPALTAWLVGLLGLLVRRRR